jgi:hypothetical protein
VQGRHLANGRSAPFKHSIGNKPTGAALSEHNHKSHDLAVAAAAEIKLQILFVCFVNSQQKQFFNIN